MKRNEDIRSLAKSKGVHLWEVASEYGLADTNFSKLLRKELPMEKRQRIIAIIENIAQQNGGEN